MDCDNNNATTEGNAIQFIRVVNGKFEITAEAKSLLQTIRNPLTIIGVIGQYRSGKSYLLNRLMGKQSGFDVGHTVVGCTRGLWIWSQPLLQSDKTIMLLDTEGLFDTKNQDPNYDKNLFCLTILLTSYLILNSSGVIDEAKIRQLGFVTQLAQTIRTKPNDEQEETGENFDVHFPDLLWVVRDFVLAKDKSDKEYLEDALKLTRPTSSESNNIRTAIRDMFKNRSCFTIMRPCDSDDDLQRVESISESKLRPGFIERMGELTQKILSESPKKQLLSEKDNKVVNVDGPGWITLAEFLLKAFNEGQVPSIAGAWETLCQVSCQKGIDEAVDCYREFMKDTSIVLPLDSEELNTIHKSVYKDVIEIFHKSAIGDTKEAMHKLSNEIAQFDESNVLVGGLYSSLCQKNMDVSQKTCQDLFQTLFAKLVQQTEKRQFTTFEEYKKTAEALFTEYLQAAIGPARNQVWKSLKPTLDAHEQQQVLSFKLDQTKRELVAQNQQLEKMQLELVEQHAEAKKFRENLEAAQVTHQKEITELIAKKEKELDDYRKKVEQDEVKRRHEIEQYIAQNNKEMAEMYAQQLKEMKEAASHSQVATQREIQSMREKLSRDMNESSRLLQQAASREQKIGEQIRYIPNIKPAKKLCGCVHTVRGTACRRQSPTNARFCHDHNQCRKC